MEEPNGGISMAAKSPKPQETPALLGEQREMLVLERKQWNHQ
jgi:hypothetical protein